MTRLDSVLLAGVGTLLVHQGAYTLTAMAGAQSSVAHGHMQTAWLLASLALLGLLTRSIVRSVRQRADRDISELSLFAWISFGYTLLEQAERIWDGYSALTLFSEPVFWAGLALGPLVSLVLTWSLRSFEKAVARLARPALDRDSGVTHSSSLSLVNTQSEQPALWLLVLSAPRRGPPRLSFS